MRFGAILVLLNRLGELELPEQIILDTNAEKLIIWGTFYLKGKRPGHQ